MNLGWSSLVHLRQNVPPGPNMICREFCFPLEFSFSIDTLYVLTLNINFCIWQFFYFLSKAIYSTFKIMNYSYNKIYFSRIHVH